MSHTDFSQDYLFERWSQQADENIDEWGEQSIETLLLCLQEELGELTQATLEYRAEDGYYGPLFDELDDIGALLIQFESALSNHRFDVEPIPKPDCPSGGDGDE